MDVPICRTWGTHTPGEGLVSPMIAAMLGWGSLFFNFLQQQYCGGVDGISHHVVGPLVMAGMLLRTYEVLNVYDA